MTLLHPRAPKIRHLNASHSLLIELEKHVKKVQELESKVFEMEMQLQLKERGIGQTWKTSQEVANRKVDRYIAKDTEELCPLRLDRAKRKKDEVYNKRAEDEANILKAWHMKRLGSEIHRLSQIPESDMIFLPENTEITEKDLISHNHLLDGLCDLINLAHPTDRVTHMKELLEERDTLRKILEELEAKVEQSNATVEECKKVLHDVNAARSKVAAQLDISKAIFDSMLDQGQKRKTCDVFIFGPNPIFSSVRDIELNYSVSNQFVIEMMQELDITQIVAKKNMDSAFDVKMKIQEKKEKLEENLFSIQNAIDLQIEMVNNVETDVEEVSEKKIDSVVLMHEEAEKKL